MKAILMMILTALSLNSQAGPFPIDFGKIETVINDVQKLDKIANKDKPHVCRYDLGLAGSFQGKGKTLAAAKYDFLKNCENYSHRPFHCSEPPDKACERDKSSETVAVTTPAQPAAAPVCVRKGKICEKDLFECEFDNGATQRIYITKVFQTNKGEYAVADYETNSTGQQYDLQVAAKNIDLNVCDRVRQNVEESPIQ